MSHAELMYTLFYGRFHLDSPTGFTRKHLPVCEKLTLITTAARTSNGEPTRK